jgi:ATP/maltotriose-dependent transcriptional regulator MalT
LPGASASYSPIKTLVGKSVRIGINCVSSFLLDVTLHDVQNENQLLRSRESAWPLFKEATMGSKLAENSVKLKLVLHRDRFILPSDAWKTIAQSLHISNRELQIIQGIFDDRKEFAIADELKISVHTVHTHLERLYRKLGVSSRVTLVLYILSEYLSSLPPTL